MFDLRGNKQTTSQNPDLLELSKETPKLKFRLRFFFVQLPIAVKSLTRIHDVLTDEHKAWRNGGRREVFAVQNQQLLFIIRSKRIQNMHTAFAVGPHYSKRCRAFSERVGPRTLSKISLGANIYR